MSFVALIAGWFSFLVWTIAVVAIRSPRHRVKIVACVAAAPLVVLLPFGVVVLATVFDSPLRLAKLIYLLCFLVGAAMTIAPPILAHAMPTTRPPPQGFPIEPMPVIPVEQTASE